jgi:hypothetical protein
LERATEATKATKGGSFVAFVAFVAMRGFGASQDVERAAHDLTS